MNRHIDRRTFLSTTGVALAGASLLRGNHPALGAADEGKGAPHAEILGWRLGCQAWTFHDMSLYDAMDNTAKLGLHYLEGYPGQKLISSKPNDTFGPKLSASLRSDVKKRLADKGLKLVNFGVGPADRAAFDFGKDMGLETLVSEPPFDAFDQLDKLCEEYQINVALHDHPRPSRYWSPDIVLKACKDHSKRIGACCDTGHWMRSDIKPLDALKQLEGRIISFHFKDLNKFGESAHDVPWGTGQADIKALLAEVKRQKIKPVFSIEYEYNYGHSMPELVQCVEYFDKTAAELSDS